MEIPSNRPMPAVEFAGDDGVEWGVCIPAPEIEVWAREHIIDPSGRLHNEDHIHLTDASIGFLWTNIEFRRQMNAVVGMAEILTFRCGAWQKGRQEQQIRDWFGLVPDFLITIYAPYALQADDATWCALIEHELYHCGQEMDEFGAPKFSKEGRPKFAMRGHDVEEFVGIVRRYGVGASAGKTAALVDVAKKAPEVAAIAIAHSCGNCLRLAA